MSLLGTLNMGLPEMVTRLRERFVPSTAPRPSIETLLEGTPFVGELEAARRLVIDPKYATSEPSTSKMYPSWATKETRLLRFDELYTGGRLADAAKMLNDSINPWPKKNENYSATVAQEVKKLLPYCSEDPWEKEYKEASCSWRLAENARLFDMSIARIRLAKVRGTNPKTYHLTAIKALEELESSTKYEEPEAQKRPEQTDLFPSAETIRLEAWYQKRLVTYVQTVASYNRRKELLAQEMGQ